jgi:CheY-like chemotaxis protein
MANEKGLILIIEDDAPIREQLVEVFSGEGFPVKLAENGQVALDLLTVLHPLPSLIVLDLMMPALNGQGFLLELQKKPQSPAWVEIPIVILSAAKHEVYGQVVRYLRKPPQLDTLIELAEKYALVPRDAEL